LVAGWRRCRERTKSGLMILERNPKPATPEVK
jgi:hypothetical protein